MTAMKFDGEKPRVELVPVAIWNKVFNNGVVEIDATEVAAAYRVADRAMECLDEYQCGDDCAPWSFFNFITPGDLMECVKVLEFGALKYDPWNWLEGMPHSKIVGSCIRHCYSVYENVTIDAESELLQRGHIICNMLFLAYYVSGCGEDDRPGGLNTMPVYQESV